MEQAATDTDKFWLRLSLNKLPYPDSVFDALLRLPDGRSVPFQKTDWQGSVPGQPVPAEIPITYEFSALPAGIDAVTLQFRYATAGQSYWVNTDIPLKLRPLQKDELIPDQSGPLQSQTFDGVTLVLDHLALGSDKSVLQVSLRYVLPDANWIPFDWAVTLSGPDGTQYPLKDISLAGSDGRTKLYQTVPLPANQALTISLVSRPDTGHVPVSILFNPGSAHAFVFDPGPKAHIGESWPLDESYDVGAFKLHLTGVRLAEDGKLVFTAEAAKNAIGFMLQSSAPDERVAGAAVFAPGAESARLSWPLSISRGIPQAPFSLYLEMVQFNAYGRWQIHWPPAGGAGTASAPAATPTPVSTDPIVLSVQALEQENNTVLQQGGGWVHEISTYKDTKNESWFEVSPDGYVTRWLGTDMDEQGKVTDQTAAVGRLSVDFTSGETQILPGSSSERLPLNGLTDYLVWALKNPGTTITGEDVPCEDKTACLLVTSRMYSDAPSQEDGVDKPVIGIKHRSWIDLQTGETLKMEYSWILEGGREQVFGQQQTLVLEKLASAPQEVLDLLGRLVRP